jgi:protein-S-isoprenylcysteine O-methyltransferase Ste14
MNSSGSEVVEVVWRQIKAIAPFPGVMAVVIPALVLLTVGRGGGIDLPPAARVTALVAGLLLVVAGLAMFCWTVSLFARHGEGTLSPLDAPRQLVVVGPYRHVRNPMYAAVFAVQIGEALTLQSWTLLVWFLCFAAFVAIFVPRKEEHWLVDQFGAQYEDYRAHVPRWIPRPTPWSPAGGV